MRFEEHRQEWRGVVPEASTTKSALLLFKPVKGVHTHREAEYLGNQKPTKGAHSSDNECVEEGQEEKTPSEGVFERFSSLSAIPLGVSDTLVVLSKPLDQVGLLLLGRPSSLGGRVGMEHNVTTEHTTEMSAIVMLSHCQLLIEPLWTW